MNSMRLDAGLAALADLENEIDAIVRELDDLRLDADVEAAAAPVDVHQARNVGLYDGPRQRAALLRLDFALELLVLDLLVSFEGDAVDDGVLDNGNNESSALDGRPHVLEQSRGIKRLDAFIDLEGIKPAAWTRPEIGTDRIGFDPLVALDDDGVDGERLRIGSRAVNDTTADLNKLPRGQGRQRQVLEQSTYPISFPYTPFVVPIEHSCRRPRERSSPPLPGCPLLSFDPHLPRPSPRSYASNQAVLGCGPLGGEMRMSLYVAKIISITTMASPMRKPTSCARSDSGFPRTASIA